MLTDLSCLSQGILVSLLPKSFHSTMVSIKELISNVSKESSLLFRKPTFPVAVLFFLQTSTLRMIPLCSVPNISPLFEQYNDKIPQRIMELSFLLRDQLELMVKLLKDPLKVKWMSLDGY